MIEIRDLGPDEKITEPGCYRMPLEQHHNQPCIGVSVTSSVLRTLEYGTPADVWWASVLNPDRYEAKERAALWMGRAMHAWIEGGEEVLKRDFIVLPESCPKRPTEAQLNAENPSPSSVKAMSFWEKVWARQKATGKDLITHSEFETIKLMGEALARDPLATAVIGGEPEITMAYQDEETGLWVLSRLDNMTWDGLLSDYKKISTQGDYLTPQICKYRTWKHGYHMQLALGAEAYFKLTGNWPTDCALVYQMDSVPYHSLTLALGQKALYWGMVANHRSMRLFRKCLDEGHWPGPGEDPQEFGLTDKQDEAFQKRQAEGDLPQIDIPDVWRA